MYPLVLKTQSFLIRLAPVITVLALIHAGLGIAQLASATPTTSASAPLDAPNADAPAKMLQFKSGGHIVGFQPAPGLFGRPGPCPERGIR